MGAERADALFLMDDCVAMILADGIPEPAEFQALHKIKTIPGPSLRSNPDRIGKAVL
jgi:hypothetical protein